ncbi:galactoside alpha-(1,2)-fucosyltransferase 2-like [Ischnura elegans]|uniref:galactoside alpha-(1,2)-fucosyltransferase 2-like n=1 Tax=Ischnura elegans TaxID=197161 RepID=UPI001ED897E6|nr:galactoside alpha-(1,2)-fucosyltransferase 2-like [Ischnura elegans]
MITTPSHGRFGNLVWEYASTVAIGHFLHRTPYLPRVILNELRKVFRDPQVPAYEDTILSDQCRKAHGGDASHCWETGADLPDGDPSPWNVLCYNIKRGDWLSESVAMKPIAELQSMNDRGAFGDVVILPVYISHTEAVSKYGRERFRQLFQFRPEISDLARRTIDGVLNSCEPSGDKEFTFVGIHARRTDYTNHLKDLFGKKVNYADVSYYQRAMARMVELRTNKTVLFLVVSDDRDWCLKNLVNEDSGVFWGGLEGTPYHNGTVKIDQDTMRNHDLALMASLNDSIISYGTFGVTGALLAGGHTITFKLNYTSSAVRTIENPPPSNYFEDWEMMD